MPRRRTGLLPDPIWTAFERRHRGNPFLREDPLYALTSDVIASDEKEIPGFFGPGQKGFEEDLFRRTGGGFFLQRSIGLPLSRLALPDLTIDDYLQLSELSRVEPAKTGHQLVPRLDPLWFDDRGDEAVVRAVNDFLVTAWGASGYREKDIEAARQQAAREGGVHARRGEAYAAWLILNPQYRAELRQLRASCQAKVVRYGGLPASEPGGEAVAGGPRPARRGRWVAACFAFYRRWGLARLLTWDLPIPAGAVLHEPEGRLLSGEEGITLSVPWYLLRGGKFDLQAIAQRIRFEATPPHLRPWVCPREGVTAAAGEILYQRLYGLYRCYTLVLFRRFASACGHNLEKVDRALARVMGRDADLVKKLRLRLTRQLREQS